MKRAGTGLIQVNSDFGAGEFPLLRAAAELAQRPLSLLVVQMDIAPNRWGETLASLDGACADGLDLAAICQTAINACTSVWEPRRT